MGSKKLISILVVTITEEPEPITPPIHPDKSANPEPYKTSPKEHRASLSGKRMLGRRSTTSLNSISGHISELRLDHPPALGQGDPGNEPTVEAGDAPSLLGQVTKWLHEERARRRSRKKRPHALRKSHSKEIPKDEIPSGDSARPRTDSESPDSSMGLDYLEQILTTYASSVKEHARKQLAQRSPHKLRRSSTARKSKRHHSGSASDTEYQDGDQLVPGVDAVLDNSKTLAYTGGLANDNEAQDSKKKDKDHWVLFKKEIVRLTHTLQLKGWRNIPIESGGDIDVERLSGALTNAVYVVSPPEHLTTNGSLIEGEKTPHKPYKSPHKLLLRIYGPQVSHLIDRQSELTILRRLARKKIGPRLLGTFSNGRFEEFLHARTLTAQDLRVSDTSKQIAKRMRELHDGIALLDEERQRGPMVIANWRKWVARCEKIVMFIDDQITKSSHSNKSKWKSLGFVCGTPWPIFRATVEKYFAYLTTCYYANTESLKSSLVFAHNDTQYGNLLRLLPHDSSPLLTPQNTHKQLVVIDFEYASANTPGLEFANHFTEWCYDYHDQSKPWACNASQYPNPAEQRRFIKAYVEHKPEIMATPTATPKSTPSINAKSSAGLAAGSLEGFLLDSRSLSLIGGGAVFEEEEKTRLEQIEAEVNRLLLETKVWRVANSAQWVAWGVVQARVDGFEDDSKANRLNGQDGNPESLRSPTSVTQASVDWKAQGSASQLVLKPQTGSIDEEAKVPSEDARSGSPESRPVEDDNHQGDEDETGEEDGFDYLAYAQERVLLFWGDVISLGIVTEAEVKEWMCSGANEQGHSVWERIKRVDG
ncbi:MAG: hypothetical protein Q9160_003908 [Pyrenula sp. 1 TL-2023]